MTFREPKGPREPRPLGELIQAMSVGTAWAARLTLGRLRREWADVAGAAVAAHSEPVKLEAGVLTIRTEAGAWATEMSLLAPRLAERADAALGGGQIREVRVVSPGSFEGRARQ